jgi:tetratricopeptide (TPR) repeat protein
MIRLRNLIAVSMTALMVISCVPKASVKKPRPAVKKTAPESARSAKKRAAIMKLIDRGRHREALLRISAALKAGEKESAYRDARAKAINALVKEGQSLETAGNISEAAMGYRTALDHFPPDSAWPKSGIEKPAAFLRKRLGKISDTLMDDGLRKYRAGRLREAIAVWDSLLAFDPDNMKARSARETAETQLRNLNRLQ